MKKVLALAFLCAFSTSSIAEDFLGTNEPDAPKKEQSKKKLA